MGVDVNLYAVGPVTEERLDEAREFFSERCRGDQEGLKRASWSHDLRIEVDTLCRYYGPGYERGYWPDIYTWIVTLRAALPECTIYYGGDSDLDAPEVTDESLAEIWAHFLGPHYDDYHKH